MLKIAAFAVFLGEINMRKQLLPSGYEEGGTEVRKELFVSAKVQVVGALLFSDASYIFTICLCCLTLKE